MLLTTCGSLPWALWPQRPLQPRQAELPKARMAHDGQGRMNGITLPGEINVPIISMLRQPASHSSRISKPRVPELTRLPIQSGVNCGIACIHQTLHSPILEHTNSQWDGHLTGHSEPG